MRDADLYDVAVLGGGASGMFAACIAASRGARVVVIDKNKSLGEKLAITGGGRCNITNAEYDIHALLKNYGADAKFLYSPFSQFGVEDTFKYFSARGLPLVIEARGRAFPETQKATDVVKVLEKELKKHKVSVVRATVKRIVSDSGFIERVETTGGDIRARAYILATGGASHKETGSTGDGFTFLKSIGHTVKDPTPTIVPLSVRDRWIKILAGVSLKKVSITFFLDDKKQFSKTGDMLCTHFGLSGPTILNSASAVSHLLEGGGAVTARIDAHPTLDLGALEKKVIAVFDANKNKTLKTVFKELCPVGSAKGVQTLLTNINFETKVHSVSKDDRKKIVRLLKALPVSILGLMGYDRAVVADGGVPLSEIDTRTMRSLKYDNLFVTGDLLHINRPSGGYSLQLCWTTGFVAGTAASLIKA
ncbi:MAG: aminoacetone oxidase family FAD-binding enzyme [Patescibacteria group bacterium]